MKKIVSVTLLSVILFLFIACSNCQNNEIIATGTVGENGAPWRLYGNGNLVVDEGFIEWDDVFSPWFNYVEHIQTIEFTDSIIAGNSLRGLFAFLDFVETIERLEHFDTSNVADMSFMFSGTWNLRSFDLTSFDTSNVTDMNSMFSAMWSVEKLDLTSFDTSNVADMSSMFSNMRNLTTLDLSNFNVTSQESVDMWAIFYNTDSLSQITLGENFSFWESEGGLFRVNLDDEHGIGFSSPPPNNEFTGYWQNVCDGTVDNPQGEFVFTAEEFVIYFDGVVHADTWVWQPR